MAVPIESKLPEVGTTIFTVMSQLAAETGAINLSQGFPEFDPPAGLLERVRHHLEAGRNQYAPMPGVPALREAIAAKTLAMQGHEVDADTEVTVCTGATEGMFAAIQAIVRRGDEVILFDPAYDAYAPAVALAGGTARHLPLSATSTDYEIDWDGLEAAISSRTRALVLNFPHNPSGAILDRDDLDRLAGLLASTPVLVLSDEVYEHIVFDGHRHESIVSHDELSQRSLVISSFGKTFHATGWKIGYCLAPAALTTEFRKIRQFTTFAVNTPMQHAIADFLDSDPGFYRSLPAFYQDKRDLFVRELDGSRLALEPSRSTFFQTVDYSAISDRPDTEIAERWTRDIGVASIPYSAFCEKPPDSRRLRFCFAKDDATLEAACTRLRTL